MPKYKSPTEIMDRNIRKDRALVVIGKIRLSGSYMWIGTANTNNDRCLFIADDETVREPIYLSSQEARMIISVLETAIEENEE